MHEFYTRYGKRLFDLMIAIPALIVLSPVIAGVAILVRTFLGTPILFRQERPGFRGQSFRICKFRTMTDKCDPEGRLLPDEKRLTPFGKFLRSSSLDELPELWNVIIGQMSLVGPRPLKTSYLSLYSPEQARRHDALPGITGWAQVNGRNNVAWEKRFELDVWYVDNQSLWLDIKILWMTVAAVFGRKGISAEGHATMPEFEGSARPVNQENQIVVIGAGGHSKVVVSTLQAAGMKVDAIYDDFAGIWGSDILGVPVRGPLKMLADSREEVSGVIAIGQNSVRERLAAQLKLNWMTVVHPSATIHPSARIGPGTVIFAGAVIQPDVVIGSHSIINTAATIDHDGRIGDFVAIAPGSHLAGAVTVGDRVSIGTGCSVIPKITIANDATIGAGTVVIRDVPAGCTLVGQTPRIIRYPQEIETLQKSA